MSGGTGQLLLEGTTSIYSETAPKKKVKAPTNAERQMAKFEKELETKFPDMPKQGLWLKSDGVMNKEITEPPRILLFHKPDIDDDDDSPESWEALSSNFMEIKHFIGNYTQVFSLLFKCILSRKDMSIFIAL